MSHVDDWTDEWAIIPSNELCRWLDRQMSDHSDSLIPCIPHHSYKYMLSPTHSDSLIPCIPHRSYKYMPHLSTEMPDCQGNPCLHGFCHEDQCVCYTNYVGEDCSQFQRQGRSHFILFGWNIRARLHWASVSVLHQLCDDTSNTVLILTTWIRCWGAINFRQGNIKLDTKALLPSANTLHYINTLERLIDLL